MLDLLREKLRKHMNDYADDLAGGGIQTIEEYKRITGIIAGLALAEQELLELAQRALKDDFED